MTVASAAAGSSEEPGVALVIAMIGTLDLPALAELESALGRKLAPGATAAERRVAELGYLARLLEEVKPSPSVAPAAAEPIGHGRRPAGDVRTPRLRREIYEARQPRKSPSSPTAAQLVERYGSWVQACRSAYGLLSDGRSRGGGSAWAQPLTGKRRPRYEIDDVRANIRRCALELGRVPSAGDYHLWAREAKAKARATGAGLNPTTDHPRIPGIAVVYRLFKKSGNEANRWRAALADVGLTEMEVATARTIRLIGVTKPPSRERLTNAERDASVEAKPLHQAIELAIERNGSLEWLAGRSLSPGKPPAAGSRFSSERLRAARELRGVKDSDLQAAIKLQLGPWRRMLAGKIEPTFGQLVKLAALAGLRVDELLSA